MSKIDEKKLEAIVKIQTEVVSKIRELERLQATLNEQERVLSGGWAFVARNPWTATDVMLMGGELVFLQLVLQLAMNHVMNKARTTQPPKLEVEDGGLVN
jgi:hypothetical protein